MSPKLYTSESKIIGPSGAQWVYVPSTLKEGKEVILSNGVCFPSLKFDNFGWYPSSRRMLDGFRSLYTTGGFDVL